MSNIEPEIPLEEPVESEPVNHVADLLNVDLSTIPSTQKLGVSWCIDPDDFDDGGVVGGLSSLTDHVTLYAGAGKGADALAIVHVDQVGRPGSLAAQRAGAKIEWLDAGSCTWDFTKRKIVVALKVREIEPKATKTARRNTKKLTNWQAQAIRQGHPQEILDLWATLLES